MKNENISICNQWQANDFIPRFFQKIQTIGINEKWHHQYCTDQLEDIMYYLQSQDITSFDLVNDLNPSEISKFSYCLARAHLVISRDPGFPDLEGLEKDLHFMAETLSLLDPDALYHVR